MHRTCVKATTAVVTAVGALLGPQCMLMHALLLPLERSMYDRLMRPFWLARPGKGRRPGHLSALLLPLLVHRALPISRAGGGAPG